MTENTNLVVETNDRQALRRADRRRGRAEPQRAPGRGLRIPRPQRRRQDDHAADAPRADPAHDRQRARPRRRPGRRRARPARSADRVADVLHPTSPDATTCASSPATQGAETRIAPVLEEVDLASRAGDRFGTYSLGMKQRLGIAAVLLKDPSCSSSTSRRTGWTRRHGRDAPVHPQPRPGQAHGPPLEPPHERGRAGLRPRRRHQPRQARRRGTVDELRGRRSVAARRPHGRGGAAARSLRGIDDVARTTAASRIAASLPRPRRSTARWSRPGSP